MFSTKKTIQILKSTTKSFSAGLSTLKNIEGQNVPTVVWPYLVGKKWTKLTSDELFSNKKIAVLSLPGAFTPTCSLSHLPRYNELFATFKKCGIDEIVCISVNDAFVMNEWKTKMKCFNVLLVPDGNGEFTRKMGMLVDKTHLGFGMRSWRYSMLVNNKRIEKMWIESEKEGDPFEVTNAETMIHYLNPNLSIPKSISIITIKGCPYCEKAKELLNSKNLFYDELIVDSNVSSTSLRALSGSTTVPQVFYDGKLIGGSNHLEEFLKKI